MYLNRLWKDKSVDTNIRNAQHSSWMSTIAQFISIGKGRREKVEPQGPKFARTQPSVVTGKPKNPKIANQVASTPKHLPFNQNPADNDDPKDEMNGMSVLAVARRRERERCAAILLHDSATNSFELACVLAFKTLMTRGEAVDVLALASQKASGLGFRGGLTPNVTTRLSHFGQPE